MTDKDKFLYARKLIEKPDRWIKNKSCHEIGGVKSYCLIGAFDEAEIGSELTTRYVYPLLRDGIMVFNDRASTTHADVLAFLDTVIEGVIT